MNLNKRNLKSIRGVILFIAFVYLVVIHFGSVVAGVAVIYNIVKPFIIGAMIAFIINLPMQAIENRMFRKKSGKYAEKIRRPISLILAILFFLFLVYFLMITVVPQVVATATELGNKIPAFMEDFMVQMNQLMNEYPQLEKMLGDITLPQINWDTLPGIIWEFAQSGISSMLTSTFTVAGNIVSGVVNFFISLIFSIYILLQKEKLGRQCRRILHAYLKEEIYEKVISVCGLLNKNFSNFIAGQCTEAIILGVMFIVTMAIFRFPYAVMVGVLISFTALIPIVGAFIGCFVGAFLILVDSPEKVLWFIVLFLILQQIEGNLIYPYVVGNSVGLPSIWVLAAVTVGGSLLGVVGMLVFIPLTSTLYTLIRENVNKRNGVWKAGETGGHIEQGEKG